jgi:hypothetical protein
VAGKAKEADKLQTGKRVWKDKWSDTDSKTVSQLLRQQHKGIKQNIFLCFTCKRECISFLARTHILKSVSHVPVLGLPSNLTHMNHVSPAIFMTG